MGEPSFWDNPEKATKISKDVDGLKSEVDEYKALETGLDDLEVLQEMAAESGNPGWGIFDSHPDPEQRLRNIYKLMEPLKISPSPLLNPDGTASVKEVFGNNKDVWEFRIAAAAGGNKPMYRAELLAGALYQVRQKETIEPSHFIVFETSDRAEIYYEDIQLYTVYGQDASGFSGIGAGAADCVEQFRKWVEKVNQSKNLVIQ